MVYYIYQYIGIPFTWFDWHDSLHWSPLLATATHPLYTTQHNYAHPSRREFTRVRRTPIGRRVVLFPYKRGICYVWYIFNNQAFLRIDRENLKIIVVRVFRFIFTRYFYYIIINIISTNFYALFGQHFSPEIGINAEIGFGNSICYPGANPKSHLPTTRFCATILPRVYVVRLYAAMDLDNIYRHFFPERFYFIMYR